MTPPVLLTGCGACGSMEAQKKCACHAMIYCNEICQRADRIRHRKACKRSLAIGEAPDSDDLFVWVNLKKKVFIEAFKSQMGLDVQSNRGRLKDKLAIYFLKFHDQISTIEHRFSFAGTCTIQVDEMAKGPIIIGGMSISLERIATDIRRKQASWLLNPHFDGPEYMGLAVFLTATRLGEAENSPCCAQVLDFPFKTSDLDSFAADSGFQETLHLRLKSADH